MRKRQRKNTLPESKDQRIAELEEQLAQALATIQELQKLQKEVERLQAEVEELKRAGKRQAAPFCVSKSRSMVNRLPSTVNFQSRLYLAVNVGQ
ncbi:MAG: SlyX family protein [Anaerolineales bacterium]|nr:SlyX family protein [Anaerolineales bacterium]